MYFGSVHQICLSCCLWLCVDGWEEERGRGGILNLCTESRHKILKKIEAGFGFGLKSLKESWKLFWKKIWGWLCKRSKKVLKKVGEGLVKGRRRSWKRLEKVLEKVEEGLERRFDNDWNRLKMALKECKAGIEIGLMMVSKKVEHFLGKVQRCFS